MSLSGGVTYAFTNITEFGDSLSLFAPNQADPALPRLNNRLSFAPLWSGVASATYTVPLSASLAFHANVSEKYNSSYNTGSDLDPRKLQGAYGLLNARLGLGAPDGKWTVEIVGRQPRRQVLLPGRIRCAVPVQPDRCVPGRSAHLRPHRSNEVLMISIARCVSAMESSSIRRMSDAEALMSI